MDALIVVLERELRGFRGRLREVNPRWYAAAASPFATRADVAFHVIERVAASAYALERPGAVVPVVPRLPDLSLADQLDVVAADYLRVATSDDASARLLGELLLHRAQLDGAPAGPEAMSVVRSATGVDAVDGWLTWCPLGVTSESS